jgi:hypothetical protein
VAVTELNSLAAMYSDDNVVPNTMKNFIRRRMKDSFTSEGQLASLNSVDKIWRISIPFPFVCKYSIT